MSTVTNDLKVAIPKDLAEQHGIAPGGEVEFVSAGDTLRVVVGAAQGTAADDDAAARRRRFDEWLERTRTLVRGEPGDPPPDTGRGWTRADLYEPPRGWPRDWPL